MRTTVHYLFDPLCGWCYGATSALSRLAAAPGIKLELAPTGLFSGQGARPMNDEFAAYAWSNDQRIARLTGQSFTPSYRQSVLGDRSQAFDSGPATLALTAVFLTAPGRELEALQAIQRARFVEGQDVTDAQLLAALLKTLGLEPAAALLANPDAQLHQAHLDRIQQARALMREFNAHGVPAFIADAGARRRMLNASEAYADPQSLINELTAAN